MTNGETGDKTHHANVTDIECPNCHESKLKEIKGDDETFGYVCLDGCKAIFDRDPDFHVDLEQEKVYIFVKMRNPEFLKQLSNLDWIEFLERSEELEKKGIPFHSKRYKIREFEL